MALFKLKHSKSQPSSTPKYATGETDPLVKVHAMPEKFMIKQDTGKSMKTLIIIGVVGVIGVVIVGTVTMYYLEKIFTPEQEIAQVPVNASQNSNSASNSANAEKNMNTNAQSSQSITVAVKNSEQKTIGSGTLIIPEEAIDASVKVDIIGIVPDRTLKDPEGYNTSHVLGGVYSFSPDDLEVKKPVTLILSYTQEELKELEYKESDLKIGFGEEFDNWELFNNSQVDSNKKTVSVMLKEFVSQGKYGIISMNALKNEDESENSNINANANTNESLSYETEGELPESIDTDNDGLTDVEEDLFGTTKDMPDTDADGFTDGDEVKLFYDPMKSGGALLKDASSIQLYTSTSHGYSVLHPKKWVAKSVGENQEKSYFTSSTGEFVQIETDENPSSLTAEEWYADQSPDIDTSDLERVKIGTLSGVKSVDGRTIYLASESSIYTISYSVGLRKDMNFYTTFSALAGSFTLVKTPETNSANTNKSNTNTNANANTSTNNINAKNTNAKNSNVDTD